MKPGEVFAADGDIELNAGRRTVSVEVANTGDRPIQVGSHYHFFETNPALAFERQASYGFRLNIAAGTAVRFEPGQGRTVELVELAGTREVYGFRQQVMGQLKTPREAPSAPPPTGGRRGRPGEAGSAAAAGGAVNLAGGAADADTPGSALGADGVKVR